MQEEKPESRRLFRPGLDEIVEATARGYGKVVEELKQRKRRGENEARMVAIYLGRQLGGYKHEEIGRAVGLGKTSSLPAAGLLPNCIDPIAILNKLIGGDEGTAQVSGCRDDDSIRRVANGRQ